MKEIRAIIRLYKQFKKINKARKKAVKQEPTEKVVEKEETSTNEQPDDLCECGKEKGPFEQCFDCHQKKKEEERTNLMSPEFWKKVRSLGEPEKCPYCKKKLSKIPERKKKCEFCNEYIYPKTGPDRRRILATDDGRKQMDEFYREYMGARDLRDYGFIPKTDQDKLAISGMKSSGSDAKDYIEMRNELKKRFGHNPSSKDVVWGIFNKKLIASFKSPEESDIIYRAMAGFLYREGKDPRSQQKKVHKYKLLNIKKSSFVIKVKIDAWIPGCCEECKKQHGKVYTIEEALEKMPLPCKSCEHEKNEGNFGWCRCIWQPV